MNTIAKLAIGTFVAGLSVPGLALGGPIHDAARRADIGLVASLVRSGTDINARDANGRTPLIIAAKGGETDLVQMLLILGADPQARDDAGTSALRAAVAAGDVDAVKFLSAAATVSLRCR